MEAGVGLVDITPTGEVTLAGSPSPQKTSVVKTRLYLRALVLSSGTTKAAIVTLDALKYPVDPTVKASHNIEQARYGVTIRRNPLEVLNKLRQEPPKP